MLQPKPFIKAFLPCKSARQISKGIFNLEASFNSLKLDKFPGNTSFDIFINIANIYKESFILDVSITLPGEEETHTVKKDFGSYLEDRDKYPTGFYAVLPFEFVIHQPGEILFDVLLDGDQLSILRIPVHP